MSSPSSRISPGQWFGLHARLVLVGVIVVGCSHADTVVQVEVQGGVTGIERLEAMLTIAGQTRTLMIPPLPRSIALPTSFTVQIARSVQGPLDIAVDAFDGANVLVGHGTDSLPSLNIGQTNVLVVNLTPAGGDGGTPDGGEDGAPDTSPGDAFGGGDGPVDAATGGSGGGAGASGSGGSGGGSGTGGSSGGAGGSGSGAAGGGSGTGGDSTAGGAGGSGGTGAGGVGGNGGVGNGDGGVDAPDA